MQDGDAERELKAELGEIFRSSGNVERAYLARVEYEDSDSSDVALCLVTAEDVALVKQVEGLFRRQFSRDEHLDVLFISAVDEAKLQEVCRPFFNGA